jgi:hypothetical protein
MSDLNATLARLQEPVSVTLTRAEWKTVLVFLSKPAPKRASDATLRHFSYAHNVARKIDEQVVA